MNIKTFFLCIIILVLRTQGLVQLRNSLAKSENPLLMKILQSIDKASSDEHLLEITLKLLKSLCTCMRETLKAKEEKYISDSNLIEPREDLNTDGKVLEVYKKIYNNTCFNLRQELTNHNNKSGDILSHPSCGDDKSKQINLSEDGQETRAVKNVLRSKLDHILLKALVLTRHHHKYKIKRYNLYNKAKFQTRSSLKHSLIVILTLHPKQKDISLRKYNVVEEDLHKILHTNSTIEIDIIDTKYGPKESGSQEFPKSENFTDCHLQSLYTFLTESEKKNLTKVFRFLRRRNTIKVYIEVITGKNHSDYINICCKNGTLSLSCKKDAIQNINSDEDDVAQYKKIDPIIPMVIHNNYRSTISKIEKLVKKLSDTTFNNVTNNLYINVTGLPYTYENREDKKSTLSNIITTKYDFRDSRNLKTSNISNLKTESKDPLKLRDVSRAIILLNDFVSKQTTKNNLMSTEPNFVHDTHTNATYDQDSVPTSMPKINMFETELNQNDASTNKKYSVVPNEDVAYTISSTNISSNGNIFNITVAAKHHFDTYNNITTTEQIEYIDGHTAFDSAKEKNTIINTTSKPGRSTVENTLTIQLITTDVDNEVLKPIFTPDIIITKSSLTHNEENVQLMSSPDSVNQTNNLALFNESSTESFTTNGIYNYTQYSVSPDILNKYSFNNSKLLQTMRDKYPENIANNESKKTTLTTNIGTNTHSIDNSVKISSYYQETKKKITANINNLSASTTSNKDNISLKNAVVYSSDEKIQDLTKTSFEDIFDKQYTIMSSGEMLSKFYSVLSDHNNSSAKSVTNKLNVEDVNNYTVENSSKIAVALNQFTDRTPINITTLYLQSEQTLTSKGVINHAYPSLQAMTEATTFFKPNAIPLDTQDVLFITNKVYNANSSKITHESGTQLYLTNLSKKIHNLLKNGTPAINEVDLSLSYATSLSPTQDLQKDQKDIAVIIGKGSGILLKTENILPHKTIVKDINHTTQSGFHHSLTADISNYVSKIRPYGYSQTASQGTIHLTTFDKPNILFETSSPSPKPIILTTSKTDILKSTLLSNFTALSPETYASTSSSYTYDAFNLISSNKYDMTLNGTEVINENFPTIISNLHFNESDSDAMTTLSKNLKEDQIDRGSREPFTEVMLTPINYNILENTIEPSNINKKSWLPEPMLEKSLKINHNIISTSLSNHELSAVTYTVPLVISNSFNQTRQPYDVGTTHYKTYSTTVKIFEPNVTNQSDWNSFSTNTNSKGPVMQQNSTYFTDSLLTNTLSKLNYISSNKISNESWKTTTLIMPKKYKQMITKITKSTFYNTTNNSNITSKEKEFNNDSSITKNSSTITLLYNSTITKNNKIEHSPASSITQSTITYPKNVFLSVSHSKTMGLVPEEMDAETVQKNSTMSNKNTTVTKNHVSYKGLTSGSTFYSILPPTAFKMVLTNNQPYTETSTMPVTVKSPAQYNLTIYDKKGKILTTDAIGIPKGTMAKTKQLTVKNKEKLKYISTKHDNRATTLDLAYIFINTPQTVLTSALTKSSLNLNKSTTAILHFDRPLKSLTVNLPTLAVTSSSDLLTHATLKTHKDFSNKITTIRPTDNIKTESTESYLNTRKQKILIQAPIHSKNFTYLSSTKNKDMIVNYTESTFKSYSLDYITKNLMEMENNSVNKSQITKHTSGQDNDKNTNTDLLERPASETWKKINDFGQITNNELKTSKNEVSNKKDFRLWTESMSETLGANKIKNSTSHIIMNTFTSLHKISEILETTTPKTVEIKFVSKKHKHVTKALSNTTHSYVFTTKTNKQNNTTKLNTYSHTTLFQRNIVVNETLKYLAYQSMKDNSSTSTTRTEPLTDSTRRYTLKSINKVVSTINNIYKPLNLTTLSDGNLNFSNNTAMTDTFQLSIRVGIETNKDGIQFTLLNVGQTPNKTSEIINVTSGKRASKYTRNPPSIHMSLNKDQLNNSDHVNKHETVNNNMSECNDLTRRVNRKQLNKVMKTYKPSTASRTTKSIDFNKKEQVVLNKKNIVYGDTIIKSESSLETQLKPGKRQPVKKELKKTTLVSKNLRPEVKMDNYNKIYPIGDTKNTSSTQITSDSDPELYTQISTNINSDYNPIKRKHKKISIKPASLTDQNIIDNLKLLFQLKIKNQNLKNKSLVLNENTNNTMSEFNISTTIHNGQNKDDENAKLYNIIPTFDGTMKSKINNNNVTIIKNKAHEASKEINRSFDGKLDEIGNKEKKLESDLDFYNSSSVFHVDDKESEDRQFEQNDIETDNEVVKDSKTIPRFSNNTKKNLSITKHQVRNNSNKTNSSLLKHSEEETFEDLSIYHLNNEGIEINTTTDGKEMYKNNKQYETQSTEIILPEKHLISNINLNTLTLPNNDNLNSVLPITTQKIMKTEIITETSNKHKRKKHINALKFKSKLAKVLKKMVKDKGLKVNNILELNKTALISQLRSQFLHPSLHRNSTQRTHKANKKTSVSKFPEIMTILTNTTNAYKNNVTQIYKSQIDKPTRKSNSGYQLDILRRNLNGADKENTINLPKKYDEVSIKKNIRSNLPHNINVTGYKNNMNVSSTFKLSDNLLGKNEIITQTMTPTPVMTKQDLNYFWGMNIDDMSEVINSTKICKYPHLTKKNKTHVIPKVTFMQIGIRDKKTKLVTKKPIFRNTTEFITINPKTNIMPLTFNMLTTRKIKSTESYDRYNITSITGLEEKPGVTEKMQTKRKRKMQYITININIPYFTIANTTEKTNSVLEAETTRAYNMYSKQDYISKINNITDIKLLDKYQAYYDGQKTEQENIALNSTSEASPSFNIISNNSKQTAKDLNMFTTKPNGTTTIKEIAAILAKVKNNFGNNLYITSPVTNIIKSKGILNETSTNPFVRQTGISDKTTSKSSTQLTNDNHLITYKLIDKMNYKVTQLQLSPSLTNSSISNTLINKYNATTSAKQNTNTSNIISLFSTSSANKIIDSLPTTKTIDQNQALLSKYIQNNISLTGQTKYNNYGNIHAENELNINNRTNATILNINNTAELQSEKPIYLKYKTQKGIQQRDKTNLQNIEYFNDIKQTTETPLIKSIVDASINYDEKAFTTAITNFAEGTSYSNKFDSITTTPTFEEINITKKKIPNSNNRIKIFVHSITEKIPQNKILNNRTNSVSPRYSTNSKTKHTTDMINLFKQTFLNVNYDKKLLFQNITTTVKCTNTAKTTISIDVDKEEEFVPSFTSKKGLIYTLSLNDSKGVIRNTDNKVQIKEKYTNTTTNFSTTKMITINNTLWVENKTKTKYHKLLHNNITPKLINSNSRNTITEVVTMSSARNIIETSSYEDKYINNVSLTYNNQTNITTNKPKIIPERTTHKTELLKPYENQVAPIIDMNKPPLIQHAVKNINTVFANVNLALHKPTKQFNIPTYDNKSEYKNDAVSLIQMISIPHSVTEIPKYINENTRAMEVDNTKKFTKSQKNLLDFDPNTNNTTNIPEHIIKTTQLCEFNRKLNKAIKYDDLSTSKIKLISTQFFTEPVTVLRNQEVANKPTPIINTLINNMTTKKYEISPLLTIINDFLFRGTYNDSEVRNTEAFITKPAFIDFLKIKSTDILDLSSKSETNSEYWNTTSQKSIIPTLSKPAILKNITFGNTKVMFKTEQLSLNDINATLLALNSSQDESTDLSNIDRTTNLMPEASIIRGYQHQRFIKEIHANNSYTPLSKYVKPFSNNESFSTLRSITIIQSTDVDMSVNGTTIPITNLENKRMSDYSSSEEMSANNHYTLLNNTSQMLLSSFLNNSLTKENFDKVFHDTDEKYTTFNSKFSTKPMKSVKTNETHEIENSDDNIKINNSTHFYDSSTLKSYHKIYFRYLSKNDSRILTENSQSTNMSTTPSYMSTTPSYMNTIPSYMNTTPSYMSTTPSYMSSTPSYMNTSPSYMSTTLSYMSTTPSLTLKVQKYLGGSFGNAHTTTPNNEINTYNSVYEPNILNANLTNQSNELKTSSTRSQSSKFYASTSLFDIISHTLSDIDLASTKKSGNSTTKVFFKKYMNEGIITNRDAMKKPIREYNDKNISITVRPNLTKTNDSFERFSINNGAKLSTTSLGILKSKTYSDLESAAKQVTDWWLDDMYLKVRLPLPINSNPGMVFPRRHFAKMEEVADLGALFIDDILDYKEMLDRGELPLERATSREKGQPLCMEQFYRLLGVCRIPEVGKDRQEFPKTRTGTEEQEELVVVACRNYFYPIPVKAVDRGRLTPGEIQAQLLHAMVDAAGAPPAPRIGLLTSMNRDQWAKAREHIIKDEMNRMNLELISRALCILCLDEAGGDRPDIDPETNSMLRAMHGAGTRYHSANRWFDKTVQLIISSDGTIGMCYEHSSAEGVAVVRLAERALARAEVADRPAPPPALLPAPQAMKWNLTPDIHRTIEQAARDLDRAISDLDFKVYTYRGYGREFMKSCRTSPDVYIQLAIQYAYYKMYGYLVTTYESASLRRFRNGRVDNIRSAHAPALAWAAAMCTAETSPLNDGTDDGQKKVSFNLYGEQKKLELFEEAARKQTSIMEANILGKGIDNHLLALREMARETMGELPPVFCDDTYKQMFEFKMSTSQVATTTDGTFMGYGAVCPDGYGCSYNPKKDCVIFCIASFTSSSVTNTEAFRQSLEEALDSMKLMFQARKVEN